MDFPDIDVFLRILLDGYEGDEVVTAFILSTIGREGARFAVATAEEGSPSLSNMRRAGFRVHARQAWR